MFPAFNPDQAAVTVFSFDVRIKVKSRLQVNVPEPMQHCSLRVKFVLCNSRLAKGSV